MKSLTIVALVVFATVVISAAGQGPAFAPSEAPQALRPALERAGAAADALMQRLVGRLSATMAEGGPVAAVKVCSEEAQQMTAGIGEAHGVEIGRTSHKLRNPDNAPREWVKPFLEEAAGKPVEQVPPRVVDLGKSVGLLRPIGMKGFCLACHGESIDPSVRAQIEKAYPNDRATGFTAGEFRGFLWVEAPKNEPESAR